MKKYLFVIAIMILATEFSMAARPKVFMISRSESDLVDAKTVCNAFETEFFNELKQTFPCVDIMDDGSLREMIRVERMKQLLGSGSDEELQNIAGAIGSDYLVAFTVNMVGSQMYMEASFLDIRKAKALARSLVMGTIAQASANAKKISKDLTKQLEEYELCPFTGPLNIEVKSQLDDTQTDYANAPCGSGDNVTITTIRKSNSTLKWELNKYSSQGATGTANYDLNEKMTIISDYSCYKCKNGDQGPVKITETNDQEATVEGLSSESVSQGSQVDDGRIKLVFLSDGTYTVEVKATSKQGNLKVTKEKKFEGMCESESQPKDTKNKKIDVPIKAVFGPYKGTIKDKTLHQNESKDVSEGKEKTTVTIDFTLTRND